MTIPNTTLHSKDVIVELNTVKDSPIGKVTITVIFTSMGHRCGYVSVLSNNEYLDQLTDSCDEHFHGGITFTDTLKGITTVGFDCAHCTDNIDLSSLKKYINENKLNIDKNGLDYLEKVRKPLPNSRTTTKTAKFVRDCCITAVRKALDTEEVTS